MVISILAGLFVGKFLDRTLHTHGVLIVIFLIFGLIGGFIGVYKLIEPGEKRSESAQRDSEGNWRC